MESRLLQLIEPTTQLDSRRKVFSNARLMQMIVPLFFEQLLTMMVGIADTFMISYAGDAAVSGVSLVNMFVTIFIYLFTALAAGGAVVVSQYIGSGNRENADCSAGQLLTSAVMISVVLTGITLAWNRRLLQFLFRKVEPDVMDACVVYLRITALSFPALAVYNAGAALSRSCGRTDLTMKVSIAANIINVIGNAIGIFLLHAGVAGVAYPTLIARIFSAVVMTAVCFNQAQAVSYQWKNILAWHPSMVRRILKIAVPNGVENGLFQLVKVALSSITALFGTAQIAANGIAQSFWSLAAMIGVTMGPVFITVIGQCMGSGDIEAAEYYFRKLYRITLAGSIVWNILIFLITPIFMLVYPLSDEIIHLVIVLVLIHNLFNAAAFPASGALPNGLRAAGDVRYTMTALAVRIISSFCCGIAAGLLLRKFYRKRAFFNFDGFSPPQSHDTDPNLLIRFLKNLGRNIRATGPMFLLGVALSALFQRYVPAEWVASLFGDNRGFGVLMAATIGVPLYACGGGTIPLLQAWLADGMSMGSAAAFMITGPATKITNLGAVKIVLGVKRFVLYLLFVVLFALVTGWITDLLI